MQTFFAFSLLGKNRLSGFDSAVPIEADEPEGTIVVVHAWCGNRNVRYAITVKITDTSGCLAKQSTFC